MIEQNEEGVTTNTEMARWRMGTVRPPHSTLQFHFASFLGF
jgi:hypothetical protein